MKISLNWLRELVELPPTVSELVDLLTLAGVEVEDVITTGCVIPNVVVAQINESVQHPNADRLSVCQVDDGSGTPRQIVCGAKNYKVGDKVPLALPGAKLGPDFTIKVGKLRGMESQGMLCAADELGMPKGEDGLLILPPDSKVGVSIADLFAGDTVLDLEITPNRPDLLGVVGIAREVGTLTGKPWKNPVAALQPAAAGSQSIQVQDPALCPLYSARKITGLKVGDSPDWLRAKLEAVGLRAINNIVDITNFVMLELGQPLHAFDAARLSGDLNVRLANEGEEFAALDGKTYKLTASQLVIADGTSAAAIAGVMGGGQTGVSETTTDIWLESAQFQSQNIRRTSRQLGLSSDSSYRFERGVDVAGVLIASARAAALIADIAGGKAGDTAVAGHAQKAEVTVPLRTARVAALLGVEVPDARITQILTGFGLKEAGAGWQIPSFRSDLTREVDLIEEIARVIGMDAVPSRTQARFAAASATDRAYDRAMEFRRTFAAQGFHEARNITFVPAEPLGLAFTQMEPANMQRVKNPMIDDQVVLRPNLLHGLLTALSNNLRAGAKTVRLFEIGRVFSIRKPEEFSHAACVLTGVTSERNWKAGDGSNIDLYDLKGVISEVFGGEVTFKPDTNPALALSLIIEAHGKAIGFAGQLWPADMRSLDADAPVFFAELDLVALDKAQGKSVVKKYREIPRFPATSRDIAFLAPLDLQHDVIGATLAKANEPLLANVELFDVFMDATGEKVAADKKSLAYSLTYRSPERTLTTDEVNIAHNKLKDRLKTDLGILLRE